jgi:endonuclease-3
VTKKIAERKKRVLEIIKELKKLYPNWQTELNYKTNLDFLVAIILSAQATDKKVNEVTEKLFKKYRKLDDYLKTTQFGFEKDINQIGLFRSKSKNILAMTKMVKEKYQSKIPCELDDLIKLPGVGRKTATVYMAEICGRVEGIAVDTHVARLSWRFDLTDSRGDAQKIEKDLMEIVPREEWREFNGRLVLYGRYTCPAKKHDCSSHPLTKIYPKANTRW